jgi:hypothetical protein
MKITPDETDMILTLFNGKAIMNLQKNSLPMKENTLQEKMNFI